MRLPGGPRGRPQFLFENWDELAKRLRAARQIRLFLDFDGTLVAFRPSPRQVRLSAATARALQRLAAHRRVRVAIVSGRKRVDLLGLIRIRGVELLGLYGWDNGKRPRLAAQILAKLEQGRQSLADLPRVPGPIFLEDKDVSLTVHFRDASPAARRRIQARVRRMLPRLSPELHLLAGHSTWELAPRHVRGKGAALREYLAAVRGSYLPIFMGDDWTDEPAFQAVRRGITVLVGPGRRSHAKFRLNDSREVRAFLNRLGAELG